MEIDMDHHYLNLLSGFFPDKTVSYLLDDWKIRYSGREQKSPTIRQVTHQPI